jgi:hypothetical protein
LVCFELLVKEKKYNGVIETFSFIKGLRCLAARTVSDKLRVIVPTIILKEI